MCHKHNIIQYFNMPVKFCVLCAVLPSAVCIYSYLLFMMKSIEGGKKCIRIISDYKPFWYLLIIIDDDGEPLS